jgi:hypothetical protein
VAQTGDDQGRLGVAAETLLQNPRQFRVPVPGKMGKKKGSF